MIFYKKNKLKIKKKKRKEGTRLKLKQFQGSTQSTLHEKNGLNDHSLFYIITTFGQRAAYIDRKKSNCESKIVGFFFLELKNSEWQKLLH